MTAKKTQRRLRKSLPSSQDYNTWMTETRKLSLDLMVDQAVRILGHHHGVDDETIADKNSEFYGKAANAIGYHLFLNKRDENLWTRNSELFSRTIRQQFPLELMKPGTDFNNIRKYILAKNNGSLQKIKIDNSIILDISSRIMKTPIQDSKGNPYEKFSDIIAQDDPIAEGDQKIEGPKSPWIDSLLLPKNEQKTAISSRRQDMERIAPLLGERSLAYPPRIVFARSDGSIASEGPQRPPIMTSSRVQTESQPSSGEFVPPKFGVKVDDQPAYPVVSSVKPEWPGRRVESAPDHEPVTPKTLGLRIKLSSGNQGFMARALNLQRRITQLAGVSNVRSAGATNGTALFNIETTSDIYSDISDSVSKLIQEDAIFSKLEDGVGTFRLTDGPHDDRGSAATRQVTSIPANPTVVTPSPPTVVTPSSPIFDLSGEMAHTNIQFPYGISKNAIKPIFAPHTSPDVTAQRPIFAHYHANSDDPSAPPIWKITHDEGSTDLIHHLVDTWNKSSTKGKAQILPSEPKEQEDEVI